MPSFFRKKPIQPPKKQKTIHNFSNHSLSAAETSLLEKGLSFSPTPSYNIENHKDILKSFNQFCHSAAKLSKNSRISDASLFNTPHPTLQLYKPMKFLKSPHQHQNLLTVLNTHPLLDNFLNTTKIKLDEQLPLILSSSQHNISKSEAKALNTLAKNKDIIIKPADKNLGIVILNTNDYISECLKHLSSNTYTTASNFPSNLKTILLNTLIKFKEELANNIIKHRSIYNHLQPCDNHSTPLFYGLPKIHKEFRSCPPVRPIVAHTNSLLSRTAKFLDFNLQPLAGSYPDYLCNSTDLIKVLSSFTIPKNSTLVTLDIVNLYPSIPQQQCLKTIYEELRNKQHLLMFDPNLIIQLLEIHLHNNFFSFADCIFHQTIGIPMGASFSPTAANIFMSVFFRSFFQVNNFTPLLFKRYIDDVFMIWHDTQSLSSFVTKLNKFHPNIKFTVVESKSCVNFLDLKISVDDGTLKIQTFEKPNNLHQYLHYSSFHHKATHQSIIIGECVRYIRSNSEESTYLLIRNTFKERLIQRKYPIKLIDKCFRRVSYSNRKQYIASSVRKSDPTRLRPILKCPLPPNPNLLTKVVLQDTPEVNHLLKKPLILFTSRKNLQKHLVRANINPTSDQFFHILETCSIPVDIMSPTTPQIPQLPPLITQPSPKKCNQKQCTICSHFNPSPYFKSYVTKERFRIRKSYSCNSISVVYLISCKRCHKQYVGQTTKALKHRINRHRTSINTNIKFIWLAKHFNFPDHTISDLSVQVIEDCMPQDLKVTESFWIYKLKTYTPFGLNVKK